MRDLEPLRKILGETLRQLGVGAPDVIVDLTDRWGEVAGDPWAEMARPVVIRDRNLVVEVSEGAAAGLLKYGEEQLLQKLEGEYGPGVVESVTITRTRR